MNKLNTFVIIICALTCICIQADAEGLKGNFSLKWINPLCRSLLQDMRMHYNS